ANRLRASAFAVSWQRRDPCPRSRAGEQGGRMTPTRYPAAGLALFMAAAVLTFGCITIMQFLEKPWFFVALAAMHAGIALFVASKRTLRGGGFQLERFFKKEYAMLLPFLLIMLYSFASK